MLTTIIIIAGQFAQETRIQADPSWQMEIFTTCGEDGRGKRVAGKMGKPAWNIFSNTMSQE